ncbi:MAG: VWA domain-containing protein [Acidobacteria bacterium]|nr:VWA domain-containing protein [Acidobacteriota bacterium]
MRTSSSHRLRSWGAGAIVGAIALLASPVVDGQQDPRFRFKTGVDLVNVSATVTDAYGRFVPNLTREDFIVYEDGVAQPVSYFSNERVPVSLGIVLDTSGSMAGEKIRSAQDALNRFLYDLLGPEDEIFLYRFSDDADLVQNWTRDRDRLRWQLGRISPKGETVLYDTVAEAVPLAQTGVHRKKALVIISDGNDTGSHTTANETRQIIRESEVLVYAIGIDGTGDAQRTSQRPRSQWPPIQIPFPLPGGGRPRPQGGGWNADAGVNEGALRGMTDDSGGRTEIIRSARDLDPATARVADELSRQYYLAYPAAAAKDGRWHDIRVEIRNRDYKVRARRGYVAS